MASDPILQAVSVSRLHAETQPISLSRGGVSLSFMLPESSRGGVSLCVTKYYYSAECISYSWGVGD